MERGDRTFEDSVSYPIIVEPWDVPNANIRGLLEFIPPIEHLAAPTNIQNIIDWKPLDGGSLLEPIPEIEFIPDGNAFQSQRNRYVGYRFPKPLRVPVGLPRNTVITVTPWFKKSSDDAYDDSIDTFTVTFGS